MRKVKITALPKKAHGGVQNFGPQTPPIDKTTNPGIGSYNGGNTPEIKTKRTLQPTSLENATLEAELGETVVTNLQGEGIPEFYRIGGKPHSRGGTPLNLPPNSFIFSKDKKLAIKDPEVLKMFGKTVGKKGPKKFVPAELSKQYDLNKYREVLLNPYSDKLEKNTAELMIQNYNMKLGALALAQESLKGFDSDIPAVAMPFIETMGINPEDLIAEPPTAQELQSFKGGGQYKGKRKVKIKKMPSYDLGGDIRAYGRADLTRIWNDAAQAYDVVDRRGRVYAQEPGQPPSGSSAPQVSSKVTYDIPDDAVVWDVNEEGYNSDAVEKGHYVREDGKLRLVTGMKHNAYTGDLGTDNENLKPEFREAYGMMRDKIENTEGLKEALIQSYRNSMSQQKPGKNLKQEHIDAANAMTDQEIMDNFYDFQLKNYAVNSKIDDLTGEAGAEAWDHQGNPSDKLLAEMGFSPNDPAHTAAFQGAYIALQKLSQDDIYGETLKDFSIAPIGWSDEGPGGDENVSGVDGWYGNTTAGQMVIPKDNVPVLEDVKGVQAVVEEEAKHLPPQAKTDPAKFWTQDLANIGLGLDTLYGIQKEMPFQAKADFTKADPTFTDFRGTAARIGSQAGIMSEAANLQAGPQQRGAIYSKLQSGMVDPILRAQEAEIRTNTAIDNQFELQNAAAQNQYDQYAAGLATNLFDKTTIANQQFRNAKTQAKQNLVNQLNSAWTNRGKTQVMNRLQPDYAVDPTTGFTSYVDSGRPDIEADKSTKQSLLDQFGAAKARFPDMTFSDFASVMKSDKNLSPAIPQTVPGYPDTRG